MSATTPVQIPAAPLVPAARSALRGLYSDAPWCFRPDPAALAALFFDAPVVELPAHAVHHFTRENFVHLVDSGVVITVAELPGADRMTGVFAPGSILGGPKALLHPARGIDLAARTLSTVRLRRLGADVFIDFLNAHPAVKSDYLLTLAHNHEAQMDGLLVNGTEPVPVRLALLFESLADLEAANAARGVACTVEPTVEELALMVHATRAVVNRVLCAWEREGRIAREHRRIRLLPGFRRSVPAGD